MCLYSDFIEGLTEGTNGLVGVLTCQEVNLFECTTIGLYAVEATHLDDYGGDASQLVFAWLELTTALPHVSLVAVPNVLGELGLGKCWLVFAGAAYAWDVLDVDRETYVTGAGTAGKRTQTTTLLTMRTNAAFVNGGARFQYRDFAVEASVANSFFNNPLEGFNGTNFVANLGGFIYF